MPGFGDDPFGDYKCGEVNWPLRVQYGSLPNKWRDRDEQLGFPLRTTLEARQEEMDELRFKIRDIVLQRQPLLATASENKFTVDIDSSEVIDDEFWGNTVLVTISMGEDISGLGIGFKCIVTNSADPSDIRTYTVVRIRQRNEPDTENEVLLRGVPLALPNTEVTFQEPSKLQHLAGDFGVIIDDAEPLQFQRSAVANAVKLRAIKSNAKSYSVRGDMSGFQVSALGLYRIAEGYANQLPGSKTYQIPAGSGKFYTTIPPQLIKFDEIPADISYNDPDLGVVEILDNSILFENFSGDGKSPALAFSENVLEGFFSGFPNPADLITVTGSVAATSGELDTLMLAEAWKVTITMTSDQRDLVGFITRGSFILVNDSTEEEFYIEDQESYSAPTWTVFTSGPSAPPTGSYRLKYVPCIRMSCDWCRANVMVLEIENTQELIDGFNGDGDRVQEAYTRLLEKLLRLVPIHVRQLQVIKKILFFVTGPVQSVTLAVGSTIAFVAPFQAYFDYTAADALALDSTGPGNTLTLTVTTTP